MNMADGEGVEPVDAGAAELAYQALDDATKVHVRRILLRMVYLDDALRPQWRIVPESVPENMDPSRGTALTVMERAGIVIVRCQDGDQEQCVSIGPGVLLEAWQRPRDWIAGSRAELLARQQVAAAGAAWHERGRRDADLWSGSRMAIASCFVDGGGDVELPDQLSREFLTASMERGRRTGSLVLRHRRAAIAGACALLLVVVGGIWLANGSPVGGGTQDAARSQQLISDAEVLSGSPALAEQLALAAYRYSPSQSATDLLYKLFSQPSVSLMANAGGNILRISAANDAPLVAASSNDGSINTGSFRIWKLSGRGAPAPETTVRDVPSGALAMSPEGTLLAAACHPAGLCLWDVADARHPNVDGFLMGPKSPERLTRVTSIAFSPDGTLVAAAGENGKTYVWSVQHPAEPRLVTILPNPLTSDDLLAAVAFSARGDLLAETIQGGKTRLWNVKDPSRPVLEVTIRTGFQAVAFSPDGSMLAAAGDTRVGLWSLADPARPNPIDIEDACTTGGSGSVLDLHTIAFSPAGDQIAYSGQDITDSQATLCVLTLSPANLSLGSPTAVSIPTNFSTVSLAYTSTGELLTGGDGGLIRQWSAPLQQIDGLVPSVHGSTFDISPDGGLLAGVLAGPLYEPVGVGVWDLSTPAGPVAEATIPVDAENVGFLTPHLLMTVTGTGQVRLWDLTDPHSPHEGASLGSAVIPTTLGWSYSGEVTTNAAGTMVSVLGSDDTLHLWRVTSAYDIRHLSSIPAGGARQGPAGILPDGRTALLETSKGIQWWGIADPAHPERGGFTVLPGVNVGEGAGAVGAGSLMMVGSPPGNGSDATIGLVDVDNGEVKSAATLTKSGYYASGFSGNGSLLATTGDDGRSLTLWSTRNPGHPRRLAVRSVPQTQNIVFNVSGTTMAVVGKDSVQLWSLRHPGSPVLEGTFTPPHAGSEATQNLLEEEFAASGTLFIEEFATVYVVGGNSGDLAARLCSSLGSTITAAQWAQYAPGVPYLNPCPPSGG
jgi:WD40 repeat protein